MIDSTVPAVVPEQLAFCWCGGCLLVAAHLQFPLFGFDCEPVPLFVHCILTFVDDSVPVGLLLIMAAHISTYISFESDSHAALFNHELALKMRTLSATHWYGLLSHL